MSDGLRILDQRLAKGEIGVDEYHQLRSILTSSSGATQAVDPNSDNSAPPETSPAGGNDESASPAVDQSANSTPAKNAFVAHLKKYGFAYAGIVALLAGNSIKRDQIYNGLIEQCPDRYSSGQCQCIANSFTNEMGPIYLFNSGATLESMDVARKVYQMCRR